MAAIARRTFFCFPALIVSAQVSAQVSAETAVRETLAGMATSLSAGNASAFLKNFSATMAGREELGVQVQGLVNAGEVSSSVSLLTVAVDADSAKVQADWYWSLQGRINTNVRKQRREVLRIALRREGKRWRVTELAPIGFFAVD
jgi:hypothetical protein